MRDSDSYSCPVRVFGLPRKLLKVTAPSSGRVDPVKPSAAGQDFSRPLFTTELEPVLLVDPMVIAVIPPWRFGLPWPQ